MSAGGKRLLEKGEGEAAADEPNSKRQCEESCPVAGEGSEAGGLSEALTSYEEFRSALGYFFTLFKKPFTASLEEATQKQWEALQEGDATVAEDGGNNPAVEVRIQPVFGAKICDALEDENGQLPELSVPRTDEQLKFWRNEAASLPGPQKHGSEEEMAALEELSEKTSHLATLRRAVAWYASTKAKTSGATKEKLRIYILGASARYEYGYFATPSMTPAQLGQSLADSLAEIVHSAAPGQEAEVLLCGRDVPAELQGCEHEASRGPEDSRSRIIAKHRVGYLHDLPISEGGEKSLQGALFVALHAGIGLDHPELTASWPPTVLRWRSAAPVWLAVSSFNKVEHEIAVGLLKSVLHDDLEIDESGINAAGSLWGPDSIGPFDGVQGKRNYGVLHARVVEQKAAADEGWNLFE
eukprot:TRINITY_DN81551_c0_g1_i1.p1 TRINITY_DN81551_c0_g1~~TRINITY_DN81551_c0_g1_i1.p1  ORF type:complete len:447 (-),score=90.77 TRINITY_DN81551_c0_g1_i1:621-1856(-)